MLTKKSLSTVLMLLLMTTVSFSQAAEKTLVKAFNLQGNNAVVLNLDGQTEVQNWNENYLRIQMTIGVENGSDSMLKSLIKVGRYNLKGTTGDKGFEVTMPNVDKTVKVGGRELQEIFSYVIYAPENVSVSNINEASAALDLELENSFK